MIWLRFFASRLTLPASAAALLTLASLPAAADVNDGQGGESIDISDSGPDCGMMVGLGWELGVDDSGDYVCECTDSFFCGGGGMFDDGPGGGGGDGDRPDVPPGGGGGDDECANDDDQCICEQEDPEPQSCELNCLECENQHDDCKAETEESLESCELGNLELARDFCGLLDLNESDFSLCVKYELNGAPGTGTTNGSSSSDTDQAGINVDFGRKGGSVGLSYGHSWSQSDFNSSSETYPYQPPNAAYDDCKSDAYDDLLNCRTLKDECVSYAENVGESCDR